MTFAAPARPPRPRPSSMPPRHDPDACARPAPATTPTSLSDAVARLPQRGLLPYLSADRMRRLGMRPSVYWCRFIARGDQRHRLDLSLARLHPWMAACSRSPRTGLPERLRRGIHRAHRQRRPWRHDDPRGQALRADRQVDLRLRRRRLTGPPSSSKAERKRRRCGWCWCKAAFRIDDASWEVFGMKGTGG